MRGGMATESYGILAEILNATGKERVELTREPGEGVFSSGEIPVGREETSIMKLYSDYAEAHGHGTYHGLNFRLIREASLTTL